MSNSTLKVDAEKTKSARKTHEKSLGFSHRAGLRQSRSLGLLFSWASLHKKVILYTLGVIVAVFAVLSPTLFYQPATAELHASGKTLSLEIASTEAAREKGLSGRDSLAANKGMLFVMDTPTKVCMWMKDTRISLDMIWLDSTKKVVHLEQAVLPKTYPKSFCTPTPAKYVVEINAGQIKQLGITQDQTLSFK